MERWIVCKDLTDNQINLINNLGATIEYPNNSVFYGMIVKMIIVTNNTKQVATLQLAKIISPYSKVTADYKIARTVAELPPRKNST